MAKHEEEAAHVEETISPAATREAEHDHVDKIADRLFAAQQSSETETTMSVWDALKLYPMASMWSILISFAVVMEGRKSQRVLLKALVKTSYRLRHCARRFFL